MKTIGIMVGTFNETENVEAFYKAIAEVFATKLPEYQFQVLFIDNFSTDGTREKLRRLCSNSNVSSITPKFWTQPICLSWHDKHSW